ncbi:predicted metal-dependent phosphoesterase [Longilinea arvoryzae]|uniref:Predicted metal-dependent phosphoesterase n=1 Tax=Longilinea arvoryzae TaxID=360412 RepID=A0A0S7BG79_9CHLR|nr:PHP domain-containing protein [Longilinea arvoryzae]GAP14112.1 predicted metal-dependent phosphoesterase [Longilinea arvoryzae]
MEPLWRVDFHCHTDASRDSLVNPEALIARARQRGIDRLVITDHNRIDNALRVQVLAPDRVVVGEEIKTTRGELLAVFVREWVPPNLPPDEALARLREQGAFISVSHPFDLQRYGWQLPDLLAIAPLVDAIEVFNARCLDARMNLDAAEFARQHNLAGTVGSDAHTLGEIGQAALLVEPFSSPEELRQVIGRGQVQGRLSSPLVHLASTYARWRKQFRKG